LPLYNIVDGVDLPLYSLSLSLLLSLPLFLPLSLLLTIPPSLPLVGGIGGGI
jgi:hypothetical protein